MNSTLAIIVSVVGCFTGSSGYITYRCYCNAPQEDTRTQLQRQETSKIEHVVQRQPTPPLEHILKEVVENMRDSNDSKTDIDIKIHVQRHKEKE